MYSLCGQMEMARRVPDISCKTDVITWNVIKQVSFSIRWNGSFFGYFGFSTVILSYRKVENMGDIDVAALVLSRRMKASNIRPDEYTRRNKVKNDVFLGNASVDLFRIRECCESSESIFGHASEGKIYMDNNDHWSLLLMAMVKKLLVCSLKC
ncbi:hypothetical protein V6N11_047650 [Hibiscus sabdariffa]|uniref:Uncharacterized protein n=1 Tax=Hibiscus sabdariffa TaxID=183260 RepID=A0ABR2NL90_9ROSI